MLPSFLRVRRTLSRDAKPSTVKLNEAYDSSKRDLSSETITISVHGTFAGHTEDEGGKWWQVGSSFAGILRRFMPRGVRAAEGDEVFHWSGENSERARNQAASELVEHLKRQERDGKSYHLIGHSHGGSVIWHALKLATHIRVPLKGLRSWTTVGTPFLHHRRRSAFSWTNLFAIILALALLKPAFFTGVAVCKLSYAAATGQRPMLIMRDSGSSGYDAVLRAPFHKLFELLGVPMTEIPNKGVLIGTFTPDSELHFAAYLFATREGLTIVALTLLACYTFTVLTLHAIAPALESHRIRAEAKLERRAFELHGSRWLGLFSRHDEAINGLRATLSINATFVREMMPRNRVFISDTPWLLHRPILWLLAPLYNRLLRPSINTRVRDIVRRSAQGNDRPTAELTAVTPTPVDTPGIDLAPLPPEVDDQLVDAANREVQRFAPRLRELLCQPSFAVGLDAFADELSGRELIHTAYFEHEAIAALIGCNLALGEDENAATEIHQGIPYPLRAWVLQAKEQLACETNLPTWLSASPIRRAAA